MLNEKLLKDEMSKSIDSVTLILTQVRKFPIDTSTTASTLSVDVFPKDNPNLMLFHHPYLNKISIYNLNSGALQSNILFEKEGPNGVGDNITGMYFHNFDSIFLLSMLDQRLFLVDSSGAVKGKYSLANEKGYAQLSTVCPAFLKNGAVYIAAYPPPSREASSKDFSAIEFNLSSKKIKNVFDLNEQYERGWWGRHHYSRMYHNYNSIDNLIVLSNPNDHFIYSINGNNDIRKYYAGAKKITKLEPISKNYDDEIEDDMIYSIESSQGSYSAIFYDKWKNVYYRLAFNPINRSYESPADTEMNISVIILDRKLRKIGEYYLDKETYNYFTLFITPEGLHILNAKKYNFEDDDNLSFDIFNLKPL